MSCSIQSGWKFIMETNDCVKLCYSLVLEELFKKKNKKKQKKKKKNI